MEGFGLPQIAIVEIDSAPMQEFQIFLLKSPFPMMFLLPGDVAAYAFAVGRTDAECAIAFLPRPEGRIRTSPARREQRSGSRTEITPPVDGGSSYFCCRHLTLPRHPRAD